jgi:acyl-coenzyme A synthetase/AMP-(fatty) acid ligase
VVETYARQVLGIRPDDTCFSVAKLFFAYGIGNSAFFPLATGATTVLDPARPTPQTVAERLLAERPTLFFAVPTFYAALLHADVPREAFASVRQAVSAGEPLPGELFQRFRYQVRLLDEQGAEVPPGVPGALYVRGASIATGYWCRTDVTRRVFEGEWLRTGDTYVQDADGCYTCLGRSDDMLKAGGIWVAPAEVEARLLAHPAVTQAAVVGLPDAEGIDKPVACVVLQRDATVTPAELIEFCRAGLAAFKRPREVIVVAELPTTATGKLQRFAVRAIAAQLIGARQPAADPVTA